MPPKKSAPKPKTQASAAVSPGPIAAAGLDGHPFITTSDLKKLQTIDEEEFGNIEHKGSESEEFTGGFTNRGCRGEEEREREREREENRDGKGEEEKVELIG